MKKLFLASKNKHKIQEIADMLETHDITVVSMNDYDLDDIDETGATFEENAILKAETICQLLNLPVLADDSGLEVAALDNAPGVYSARYASDHDDHANNEKLLRELNGETNRSAQFVCAMALAIPEKKTQVVRGTVSGEIGYDYKGSNGFGYDPLFFLPHLNKTMAELESNEKNGLSHRHNALVKMKPIIEREL